MDSDNTFKIAIIISVIAHGVILLQNPNLYTPKATKETMLQISYIKRVPEKGSALKNLSLRQPLEQMPMKIISKNTNPPSFSKPVLDSLAKPALNRTESLAKPPLAKPEALVLRKKITFPQVDMNKLNNPSYISYYQIIREKIRREAYQNYTSHETGEVHISFIISNAGMLKELQLIEEKTRANFQLKEAAKKSVKDASPFPNFPKELNYPYLSFNVIISFEVE